VHGMSNDFNVVSCSALAFDNSQVALVARSSRPLPGMVKPLLNPNAVSISASEKTKPKALTLKYFHYDGGLTLDEVLEPLSVSFFTPLLFALPRR